MRQPSLRYLVLAVGIAGILCLFGYDPARAVEMGPTGPTPAAVVGDLSDIGEFADSFFPAQMDRYHVPGLVVAVVSGDRVVLMRGYGFGDWEKQVPVDVQNTRFRVASISKLFAATALMQLVEDGRVSLDEDIRTCLPSFPLAIRYPGPVTPAHLLTHTGGFDDYYVGMITLDRERVVPLSEYLAARMPVQSVPPGQMVIYSNHAYSLLGYIVEVVSGVPFARYADEHILAPLGMTKSGFEIDPKSADDMAVGSQFSDGQITNTSHYYFNTGPASSLIATAPDMARFMIAHLNGGVFAGNRILSPETTALMHTTRFTHDPRIAGYCLGFVEHRENGRRAVWHAGEFLGYSSLLYLLTEENVGIFISYNSADRRLHEQFIHEFLDRYYPGGNEPPDELSGYAAGDIDRYIGAYRPNPYSRHSYTKLAALLNSLSISEAGNGALMLSTTVRPAFFGDGDTLWAPVETDLFLEQEGQRLIAFRSDEQGDVTHLFHEASAFEKLPFWETGLFHFIAIGLFNTVFFIGFLALPVGALARRVGTRAPAILRMPAAGRWITAAVCLMNLVFLVGIFLVLGLIEPWRFTLGTPPVLTALFVIPLVTVPGSLAVIGFTVAAWVRRWESVRRRLWYTAVSIALVLFVEFLVYWNLLGFRN